MQDADLMGQAIAMADDARRRTSPNPWVGCVLAADGVVVGTGATQPPGGAHAEADALAAAGSRARGATAYVTLEPCAHEGRTGPCADALVAAGVTRAVVALEDPDPHVRGRGFDTLRRGGVEVVIGVGAEPATRSLAPYLHHRRTGRAFCVVKTALSVDGRSAAADGTARWITGPAARADAHQLRADSQAVAVGAGTALADQPRLTVRDAAATPTRPPLRVLLDARGRVPASGPLFDPALAPTLVLTTLAAPPAAQDAWRSAGAKVEVLDAGSGGVDLTAALTVLGRSDVLQVLVEGGATLHGELWRAGLTDRLIVYVGATLLGEHGRPGIAGPGPPGIADAPHLALGDVTRLDDDIRCTYEPTGTAVA